jgi:hypothetical protein
MSPYAFMSTGWARNIYSVCSSPAMNARKYGDIFVTLNNLLSPFFARTSFIFVFLDSGGHTNVGSDVGY